MRLFGEFQCAHNDTNAAPYLAFSQMAIPDFFQDILRSLNQEISKYAQNDTNCSSLPYM
jgi:hypothetical protein